MRAKSQLALIGLLSRICREESVDWWLRGGWAVDFFVGRVTRDHHDIDVFAWARDRGRLVRGHSLRIKAYGQCVIDTSVSRTRNYRLYCSIWGPMVG